MANTTSLAPSEADKKRNLDEHFFYEVSMLIKSANWCANYDFEFSMRLECFLVHARCLIDFFWINPIKDDMYAKQFVDENKLPQKNTWLTETIREEINKTVAHLTYSRKIASPTDKSWPVGKIELELLTAVETFIDELPLQYQSQNMKDLKQKVQIEESRLNKIDLTKKASTDYTRIPDDILNKTN